MFVARVVTKRFILLLATAVILLGSTHASAAVRVAIVPYINSSGENRAVVDTTINSKLESYFQSNNYTMVSPDEVTAFLARNGYDATPLLLPEKEVLSALAAATGADAVLAMDFARIQANRRYSWLHSYTTGSVSIYVKALSVTDNNFVSLRIENSARLKASRFGPGVKERVAIGAGIEAAMDEMFSKLPF